VSDSKRSEMDKGMRHERLKRGEIMCDRETKMGT